MDLLNSPSPSIPPLPQMNSNTNIESSQTLQNKARDDVSSQDDTNLIVESFFKAQDSDVVLWDTPRIETFISNAGLDHFRKEIFYTLRETSSSGSLYCLSYDTLKQAGIVSVGDRARILQAIKRLKTEEERAKMNEEMIAVSSQSTSPQSTRGSFAPTSVKASSVPLLDVEDEATGDFLNNSLPNSLALSDPIFPRPSATPTSPLYPQLKSLSPAESQGSTRLTDSSPASSNDSSLSHMRPPRPHPINTAIIETRISMSTQRKLRESSVSKSKDVTPWEFVDQLPNQPKSPSSELGSPTGPPPPIPPKSKYRSHVKSNDGSNSRIERHDSFGSASPTMSSSKTRSSIKHSPSVLASPHTGIKGFFGFGRTQGIHDNLLSPNTIEGASTPLLDESPRTSTASSGSKTAIDIAVYSKSPQGPLPHQTRDCSTTNPSQLITAATVQSVHTPSEDEILSPRSVFGSFSGKLEKPKQNIDEADDIMKISSVRSKCVRVYGSESQSYIIDVSDLSDPIALRHRIYEKFSKTKAEDKVDYRLYIKKNDIRTERFVRENSIDDVTLLEICQNPDHPYRAHMILEKAKNLTSKRNKSSSPSRWHSKGQSKSPDKKYSSTSAIQTTEPQLGETRVPQKQEPRMPKVMSNIIEQYGRLDLEGNQTQPTDNILGMPPGLPPKQSDHIQQSVGSLQSIASLDGIESGDELSNRRRRMRHTTRKLQNFFGENFSAIGREDSLSPDGKQYRNKTMPLPPHRNSQASSIAGARRSRTIRLEKFFGDRPPSQLIAENLERFFPGIGQIGSTMDLTQQAQSKRASLRQSESGKATPNSVQSQPVSASQSSTQIYRQSEKEADPSVTTEIPVTEDTNNLNPNTVPTVQISGSDSLSVGPPQDESHRSAQENVSLLRNSILAAIQIKRSSRLELRQQFRQLKTARKRGTVLSSNDFQSEAGSSMASLALDSSVLNTPQSNVSNASLFSLPQYASSKMPLHGGYMPGIDERSKPTRVDELLEEEEEEVEDKLASTEEDVLVASISSLARGVSPFAPTISSQNETIVALDDSTQPLQLDSVLDGKVPEESPLAKLIGKTSESQEALMDTNADMGTLPRLLTETLESISPLIRTQSYMDYEFTFSSNPDEPRPLKWMQGPLIGSGSFGKVYYGVNCDTGDIMAVKQVMFRGNGLEGGLRNGTKVNQSRQKMLEALHREISLLKDLHHENIVHYLGYDVADNCINVFLEYVSGGSVSSALAAMGCFPDILVRSVVSQVLSGLEYLHHRGIIHRDIKGGNILIDEDGWAKISDFGISKRTRNQMAYRFNSRMSIQGSVYWMAPEVVKSKGYSAKVDIWSLGCVVLEMFTGIHPWRDLDEVQTMWRLGRQDRPPIPESIGSDANGFLQACFTIDPEERPTASQLSEHPYCEYDPDAFDFRSYKEEAIRLREEMESTTDEEEAEDDMSFDEELEIEDLSDVDYDEDDEDAYSDTENISAPVDTFSPISVTATVLSASPEKDF